MTTSGELPAAARRVADAAEVLGLTVAVVAFPEGTKTAADAAEAVGCEIAQIVKSLVFVVGEEVVLVLVSGPNRLDEAKLAGLAGVEPGVVRRATAEEVRTATSYAVGGVPPFGHPAPLRTWIDLDLLGLDVVWAAAGTPTHVFAIHPGALAEATGATPADVAVE
jgi:prolyl-tRNA editing enzyme YbaK/EbsC (Cys-tRNA(Pro) deacylase)